MQNIYLKKPIENNISTVEPGKLLYRGIRHRPNFFYFSPRVKLNEPTEDIARIYINTAIEHVMQIRRVNFVSFTFNWNLAFYYATHSENTDQLHDGYIATVRIPRKITKHYVGSAEGANAFSGDDGSKWIDPRRLILDNDLKGWLEMRERARRDDELLFAGPKVKIIRLPQHVNSEV